MGGREATPGAVVYREAAPYTGMASERGAWYVQRATSMSRACTPRANEESRESELCAARLEGVQC